MPTSTSSHPPSPGRGEEHDRIIALARKVTEATGAPVVGGVAVLLHGGGRHTRDIDIYTEDFWATHEKLESAGILWDAKGREHVIAGVPVHMVKSDSLGGEPSRVSVIDGVRVISLADLIRAKLTVGLEHVKRSKDIAHVLDLIEQVPLNKDFAAKLPRHLRAPFKELVDQIHEPRRTTISALKFRKKYA
ncbi:MAG: hypothetical protein K2W85_03350 [Phycisphaerales bacterium]|nr:hypothetical protein [Phycisphaerales bacterium]